MPTQQELYRPILEITSKSSEWVSNSQIHELWREYLPDLTQVDFEQRTGGKGAKRLLPQRVRHALRRLIEANLLISKSESPSRGPHQITDKGRGLLTYLPANQRVIDDDQIKDMLTKHQWSENCEGHPKVVEVGPEEQFEASYHQLRNVLVDELLDSVRAVSPDQFERLVVDLLVKMGYGKGKTVGRTGDGGIDGVINQDPLGLEKIYAQAKRWSNQIGEPEIRNFSGSLDAKGAIKGVFITTSQFSATARQTAEGISKGSKFIRLIDGYELADLMIEHGVGVVTKTTYELKMLDENYFADV